MSDIATTAKNARESLARGLSALQSDPSIPPHVVDLATPIAQAMGALHQIERSNGTQLVPHAENALNNVRTALSALQQQPSHGAVGQAMEAVAGSLGLVHAINKLVGQQAAQAQPQPVPVGFAPTAPQPQYQPPQQQQAPYGPPPQQQPVQMQQPFPSPQAGAPARDPFAPPQQQAPAGRSPMAATGLAPSGMGGMNPFPASGRPPAPPPDGTSQVITADLGAHSPTNFYKGFSGNDIIDHGGLFVSTYMIPKIGTPVRLKVSLPGGYEFEANAVVKWAREQRRHDAPPGFGAQFTADHARGSAARLPLRAQPRAALPRRSVTAWAPSTTGSFRGIADAARGRARRSARRTIAWLGTAAHVISTETTTVLVDPFVSRHRIRRLLTRTIAPDDRAIDRWIPKKVDAILCGHSHFDHLLDAPRIAQRTGAKLVGSATTCAFARAQGVPRVAARRDPAPGLARDGRRRRGSLRPEPARPHRARPRALRRRRHATAAPARARVALPHGRRVRHPR